MTTSIYPSAIATFPTRVDYANVVDASDYNGLAAEIVSLENTLGTNPTTGFGASTIGGVLTALNAGKSNSAHTHINLPGSPVTIGGATTGQYISISGRQIQSYINGAPSTLFLQNIAADLSLGTPTNNTSINGSCVTQGNATFSSNITCAGTTSTAALSVVGSTELSHTFINGNEFFLWDPGSPAVVSGHRSEGIYASGPYTTVFDGDPLLSTKNIFGQLYIEQIPNSATGGWPQATIQMYRPEAAGVLHYECNLGAKAWSENAGVYRSALMTFNADSSTLGWISQDGTASSTANYAMTASSFITSSAQETKTAVTDLDKGLETLQRLRPVSYMQRTHKDLVGPHSAGDKKRSKARSHGLIAEEVVKVVPEVVAYNSNGTPHGIDYGALVPLLIKSIQTLTDRVYALEMKAAGL